MCESRAVPSGKVYRQMFDAQVQLSRSLLTGRRHTRIACPSAEDSASGRLCSSSSREQPVGVDEEQEEVCRLPDTVVVDRPSSDIIARVRDKRSKRHKVALKRLDAELTQLAEVCETQVRTVSQQLLSSLQEVDLRFDTLKDRIEQLDHVSLQEVCGLWEQVEHEVKLKKLRFMELKHKLTECENQRSNKIRAVLRTYCHLLDQISFLPSPDVHRLIHTKATMLNQSLLANRRSAARLLLLLQEEKLQQESLLRLHWDECLSRWKRRRVTDMVDRFRSNCSSDEGQQVISAQQMKESLQDLTEQRQDLIYKISSLVPPTCSPALVSDWFNQLTAVNQQIDSLHADFLHQLRCCYERKWQDYLAEVEHCKEALLALQLSEEEVSSVINSQLLTMIGRSQSQDEERLAALDVCCDCVARHTLSVSMWLFALMRGAALLWETHSCRLPRREKEVQQQLDDLRSAQEVLLQRKKVHLNALLGGLRQESSEDTLKKSLENAVLYLQDVKDSYTQCVSDQWEVLDCLPALFMEELLNYSSSLSSFYHLDHIYTLDESELVGCSVKHTQTEDMTESPTQPSHDWLTEAESSLLHLSDISSNITFTSSKGVFYTGPAFRCTPPDLQQETQLSLFPVELLTHTLSRTRTLFLDHLEQHFHDVLSSAVTIVTEKKEAVSLEQELQLQQLDPQHIQTHVYTPRLAELQLHRQRVDVHCEQVMDVLTTCRAELKELQTSISRGNQDFSISLSKMEEDVLTARSSQRLEVLSSTLQDCLDQHIKHTQTCQTSFRQSLQIRLEDIRNTTTQLLNTFRLFSEGGDFAPQEVKVFQRILREKIREIGGTEESICSELEAFESRCLRKVKEASQRLEEKLSSLTSEVKFTEKVQKIISNTQVTIRAEAAGSNQHQSVISSRLEDLRTMMDNTQVSAEEIFSVLSSLTEGLRVRCQYLDIEQEGFSLSSHPTAGKKVRSAPPPGFLQPTRAGVDLLEDPVVGIIKSLNRFSVVQEVGAEGDDRGHAAAGLTPPLQRPHQKCTEPVSSLSVRRGGRSITTDRKFQIFGPRAEQDPHSFSTTVNSVLWKVNNLLLLIAEEFYCSERLGRFLLVPDTLDQWAESMQQRLLGYQEQARRFLSTSREEFWTQLSALDKLLHSLPSVLIGTHEQRHAVELTKQVGQVRDKLKDTLSASETDKKANMRQLRASLSEDELQALISREELRQQQLHSAICCSHLEIQDCVRAGGGEFLTSLASLTDKLLHHLDNMFTPAESDAASAQWPSKDDTVTIEKGADPGQRPGTGNRTWSGITNLCPPANSTAESPSSVTMATAPTSTKGHVAVIEQRDAAVKRFEQLISLELSSSDDVKRRRLNEVQSWNTHWRQQIHTLKHTHKH
ncbi:coiled-coil domain-containing protein 180 isoform X1 [Channa argus]|uniref:coiled-coil domain-containing protein 180 isoform X1 n=1 Tax=Channa argus TaxID=215402 RepID=UPI003521296D